MLIAETVRVARFNNHEDPLNLLVRVRETFGTPPFTGPLADPATWQAIQMAAFGLLFDQHFETRVLRLYLEALRAGGRDNHLTVVSPGGWIKHFGDKGEPIARWVYDRSRSREAISARARNRMLPDGLLPRTPTALLHHPLVRLSDDHVGIASPWQLVTHLRTGVWAAFLDGTRKVLKKPDAWFSAFGYMFEEWLRKVARWAASSAEFKGELLQSKHPGSDDEVDDVVIIEGTTTILFSAKARLVEEPIARHAKSVRSVMEWYEKYFFDKGNAEYRGGAVCQLDRVIQRIRAGEYPNCPVNNRIVPVLVSYDTLCEEFLLYKWLEERCASHGLLQQVGVSHLAIAHVDDFERLMARASRGETLTAFFKAREFTWSARRVQHQLGRYERDDRLPQMVQAFEALIDKAERWTGPSQGATSEGDAKAPK